MTVEKINTTKVKITLTLDELKYRKITLTEIQNNKNKAHDFFIRLIEDSNLNASFLDESTTLFIEASTCKNSFIVIITKVNLTEFNNIAKQTISYKVTSNMFEFDNIQNLIFTTKLLSSVDNNDVCLYYYNQKYYLIFSNVITRNAKFIKHFIILSEYCTNFYQPKFTNIILEYGKCIFPKNAITKLSNYTLE